MASNPFVIKVIIGSLGARVVFGLGMGKVGVGDNWERGCGEG